MVFLVVRSIFMDVANKITKSLTGMTIRDYIDPRFQLVDENDNIISSMRGAVEIAVNGNQDLKDKVMKVGGIKGYTSERELMTGN